MSAKFADLDLPSAIKTEWKALFIKPYEVLQLVSLNAILVVIYWLFSAPKFLNINDVVYLLPLAISSWAYTDIPVLNSLGYDSGRAKKYLGHQHSMTMFFLAKNLVIWAVVAPVMVVLSLILSAFLHEWNYSSLILLAIIFLPVGFFGLGNILAVLLPYHPIKWRQRIHLRSSWLRWAIVIGCMLMLPTIAGFIIALPMIVTVAFISKQLEWLMTSEVLAIALSFSIWWFGTKFAAGLAYNRRQKLYDFLSDRSLG